MVTNHDIPPSPPGGMARMLAAPGAQSSTRRVNLGDLQAGRRYEKSQLLNWLIFLGFSLPGEV